MEVPRKRSNVEREWISWTEVDDLKVMPFGMQMVQTQETILKKLQVVIITADQHA